ncbi:MAG: anhydro-N-acetylmuramic acid kinase, partial [Bacteroidetes bacterium]|nr:anhydro-N-acetylmuramic acid kinase [Bacteroidota bacterium]
MNKFSVIGVMSGTSLDGIDIASCLFEQREDGWKYAVDFAETIDYSSYWKETLGNLENATAFDFINAHIQYGHLQGKIINDFILKYNLSPDFVATHGHTIF